MTACVAKLPYDFDTARPLAVRFSDLQLSSDAGILLARQAEETVQVCRSIADCIDDWRAPHKIRTACTNGSGFINSYKVPPQQIVLDIDGWADPTHGQQQRLPLGVAVARRQ
jgi:hypothetical protein